MSMEYKNKSELVLVACGEPHTVCSNEVTANKVVIRLIKSQNKQCVFEGDCLTYAVKICNDSCVDIYNAIFIDALPHGLKYVPYSFKMNGKTETPVWEPFGNKLSYKLRELKAESEVIITFDTTVD